MALLNTVWMADGRPFDYLGELANVQQWLDVNGLGGRASAAVREALVEAREAIAGVLESGPDGRTRLNRVLGHGRLRVTLGEDGGVKREVAVDEARWRPAVLAAFDAVALIESFPGRIRRCEHPHCVRWFLDTSKNGSRRWHSMATCGNRAKAQRHYERTRAQ